MPSLNLNDLPFHLQERLAEADPVIAQQLESILHPEDEYVPPTPEECEAMKLEFIKEARKRANIINAKLVGISWKSPAKDVAIEHAVNAGDTTNVEQ